MKQVLGVIVVLLISVPSAQAQQRFTIVDGVTFNASSVNGGNARVDFIVDSDKSHCCEIWSTQNPADGIRFGSVTDSTSGTLSVTNRSAAKPVIPTSANDPNREGRKCFFWTANTSARANRVTLQIESGAAGNTTTSNVSMLCRETTLYGGFNTSVTDFNFIEISNTLEASAVDDGIVKVTLKGNAVVAGTSNIISETFDLAPGARRDFDVHSIVSQDFGPVTITHNGPPGAINARTVQYRIETISPLSFVPVSVESFRNGSTN